MKILVIGGIHGNEPLGITLVKKIRFNPIMNVESLLANENAIEKNKRFVNFDLNRSFPGDINSPFYEKRRAKEILDICNKFDLVLDFHNTYCPKNNCSFVGEIKCNYLFNVSLWLGLDRVIVADYDCLNKYALNCLSLEISMSSKYMNADYWYEKIEILSTLKRIPKGEVKKYIFVYRMTHEDKNRLKLDKQNLKAFKKINDKIAKQLNVNVPAYPIFLRDKFTPYNYGGLLNKL